MIDLTSMFIDYLLFISIFWVPVIIGGTYAIVEWNKENN